MRKSAQKEQNTAQIRKIAAMAIQTATAINFLIGLRN
jgi:hypothetical protein